MEAQLVHVEIEGSSPYSPSRFIDVPKKPKESPADFEDRVWRERCHYDEKTRKCFIPGICFVKMMHAAAKHEPMIKKGQATYTKHFERGLMVPGDLDLGVKVDDVQCQSLMVPSDGKAGGGKRVRKHFPIFPEWGGTVTFHIFDHAITEKQFVPTLENARLFIGIGRWRPEKCGWNGRFKVKNITWE